MSARAVGPRRRGATLTVRALPAIAIAVGASACAAPPLGFGASARLPAPAGRGVIEARTAVGLGAGRQVYQGEASGLLQLRRWFALEGGAVYTRVAQDADSGGDLVLNGVLPFVRPRVTVDHVSLAIGLSGLGFGGGGGGLVGGIADAQLGYGTDAWSVYAGAYRHYFELVAEDGIEASSSQVRAGASYTLRAGGGRVGLALELQRQHDDLRNDPRTEASQLWLGALKLSYTSPTFR